jgi:transposase-like protein
MKFSLQNPTSQKYEYVGVDIEYNQCEYVYLYKYVYVSCTYKKERQPETHRTKRDSREDLYSAEGEGAARKL